MSRSYRSELSSGEEQVDPTTWAGAVPVAHGIAPRSGGPLSFGHGAPLRLRNEIQLGFKQVKWIKGVEFVAHYSEICGGYGGYNEDHEFFGYRQSI